MKFLIDMNLTPQWVEFFAAHEVKSVHWHAVGDATAADASIMNYAREHGFVVLTHDLDFGSILAVTRARVRASFRRELKILSRRKSAKCCFA